MTTEYDHSFWKFLFLTYLTTQIVLFVAGADVITYTCGQSNTIEKISVNPAVPPSRILIKMTNDSLCPYSDTTCKNNNKKSPLSIVIQGETKDNGLYAGRSNQHYSIECKDEYDVEASASPMLVGTSANVLPEVVTKPTPGLSLNLFKKNVQMKKNDNVYVGEELTLEMKSTGYKVYPKLCTAIDTTPPTKTVPIWTYKIANSDQPCSTFDDAITTEKWTLKNDTQTLSIPIYAFRFMTSTSVTIKCSAHLCHYPDGICNPVRKTCMKPDARKRKRRSSGNSTKENQISKTEEAYVSFSVVSENIVRNKANDVSIRFTAFTTIIIGSFFQRL